MHHPWLRSFGHAFQKASLDMLSINESPRVRSMDWTQRMVLIQDFGFRSVFASSFKELEKGILKRRRQSQCYSKTFIPLLAYNDERWTLAFQAKKNYRNSVLEKLNDGI